MYIDFKPHLKRNSCIWLDVTCNKQLFHTVHVSFWSGNVKRWTKVNVVGFQLGTTGHHQLHYCSGDAVSAVRPWEAASWRAVRSAQKPRIKTNDVYQQHSHVFAFPGKHPTCHSPCQHEVGTSAKNRAEFKAAVFVVVVFKGVRYLNVLSPVFTSFLTDIAKERVARGRHLHVSGLALFQFIYITCWVQRS